MIVLLSTVAILAVGCYHSTVATSEGVTYVRVKPDPGAPALPVQVALCAEARHVTVGETGVVETEVDGNLQFGQASRDQIENLLVLLTSKQYLSELGRAPEKFGPIVCLGDSSVVIRHDARHLQYRFMLNDATPPSIRSLIQMIEALAPRGSGSGSEVSERNHRGVKANPALQATAHKAGLA